LENNTTTLASTAQMRQEAVNGGFKVAVNSIQRSLFVERLWVNIKYPADRIIPYDRDNLYPNKIKSIAQRSGTTMSAIETLSAFVSGDGFQGMDTVVNREGQTLWDILRHVTFSKSMFKGYALHFNYNILGQITEINPINFEFVRWSKDLKRLIVNPDWWRRNRRNEEITYCPFNPATVQAEIKQAGDISKYNGQLYYWIPNLKDWYTVCNWDSVLDDAQFEAEAKLYSLSSIQNDYSLSGIIAYPKNISDKEDIDNLKEDIRKDTGANNAGGVRVVGAMPSENLTGWKWFTPMSRNNIDNLHTNQVDRAKLNIYAAFRQPPILNGVATQGMFNQESFMDAFDYYNSQTETERKEVEKELTKILQVSIWPIAVAIQPKVFQGRDNKEKPTDVSTPEPAMPVTPATQAAPINDTLTNLSGRQLQGVFRITRKYANGDLTYDQAALMLKTGFGFDDESIKIWLINDNENG
jgi:hypothetical protein